LCGRAEYERNQMERQRYQHHQRQLQEQRAYFEVRLMLHNGTVWCRYEDRKRIFFS
jgi:hypothetical protein